MLLIVNKIISEWNYEDQLSTEEDTKQFKVTEKRLLSYHCLRKKSEAEQSLF